MQPGPASDDAELRPARRARPARPRPRHGRRPALAAVLVLALCGLGIATKGALTQVMPRRFTPAQQRAIQSWVIGRRWRTLPEIRIFPDSVPYQLPAEALDGGASMALAARRLGIGSPVGCARGTNPAAARILSAYGCATVLRATYADSTGSMLVTVGVAVLPSGSAATAAANRLADGEPQAADGSLSPAPVPGTLAAGFSGSQRQLSWATHTGSYVIMATAGYADGRPQEDLTAGSDSYLYAEMSNLELGIGDTVSGVLGKVPPTPSCPGAPGC
jgi:hypothetical protein